MEVAPQRVVQVVLLPAHLLAAGPAGHSSYNTPRSPDSLHTLHMDPDPHHNTARIGYYSLLEMKRRGHRVERELARKAWPGIAGRRWCRTSRMRNDCHRSRN